MARNLEDLIARLGIPDLPEARPRFIEALTHSSAGDGPDYERLEFLGDAVLKLAVSALLYERLPSASEGVLTKIRARVVADATLAKAAHALDLGVYLRMGSAERKSGGAQKIGTLAAAYEALLAAIYQTHGWGTLVRLVSGHLAVELDAAIREPGAENTKALLQEATQERFAVLPVYRVIGGEGPQHQHVFFVEVEVLDRVLGAGRGASKKAAEQQAAKEALSRLHELTPTAPKRKAP
jgi:ribonuclease-3